MKFILGKKLEMSQIFLDNGDVVPVTLVLAEPNVITQIKSDEKDGYDSIQVGFEKPKKLIKSAAGHLKDIEPVKTIREFRVSAEEAKSIKRGDVISVETFVNGDVVKIVGTSKGRGFQGVVKRHGFHGQAKTHGHKDQQRMPGSIGSTGPQRVFKDMRMAGRMGFDRITVDGLKVVGIDSNKNLLYIKGALPGARNSLVMISGVGQLKVKETKPEVASESKAEANQ